MAKSEIIRRSMHCFVFGWWSLVPVAGLIPALLAFTDFRAVSAQVDGRWNAGRTRLLLGAWLAGLGILITLLSGALVTLAILDSIEHG